MPLKFPLIYICTKTFPFRALIRSFHLDRKQFNWLPNIYIAILVGQSKGSCNSWSQSHTGSDKIDQIEATANISWTDKQPHCIDPILCVSISKGRISSNETSFEQNLLKE